MATISKVWASPVTPYQTDAFGGAAADVGGTETTLGDIDLETDGYEGVQVRIKVNSSGTTDNFVVNVYASLDNTNFDTIAVTSFTMTATSGNDVVATILLKDFASVRVRGVRSGSTDTFDVEVIHQRWRWQSV